MRPRWDPSHRRASRPVVLLLGSLGSQYGMWDPQIEALAEHGDVLRVDLPGHGGEVAPPGPYDLTMLTRWVMTALDADHVRTVHVVGLSVGGTIALEVALTVPERVTSVTMICSSAAYGRPEYWLDRAATVRKGGAAAVAGDVVSRWFTPSFAADHPEAPQRCRDMIASTDSEGYAAICEVLASVDLLSRLPGLAVPLLAIAGAADLSTPPEHLERVVRTAPGARLEVLPGAHLLSWERADDVTRLVLDHVIATEEGHHK